MVGPPAANIGYIASPDGFHFDPQAAGTGAGELVQGSSFVDANGVTRYAFDGLNRLNVGGTDFAPTTPSAQQAVTLSSVSSATDFTGATTSFTAITNLPSIAYTADGVSPIRLSSTFVIPQVSTTDITSYEFAYFDGASTTPIPGTTFHYDNLARTETVEVDASLAGSALTAGSHTLSIKVRKTGSGTLTLSANSATYTSQVMNLTKINTVPGLGASADVVSKSSTTSVPVTTTTWTEITGLAQGFTVDSGNPVVLNSTFLARTGTGVKGYAFGYTIDTVDPIANPPRSDTLVLIGNDEGTHQNTAQTVNCNSTLTDLTAGPHTAHVWVKLLSPSVGSGSLTLDGSSATYNSQNFSITSFKSLGTYGPSVDVTSVSNSGRIDAAANAWTTVATTTILADGGPVRLSGGFEAEIPSFNSAPVTSFQVRYSVTAPNGTVTNYAPVVFQNSGTYKQTVTSDAFLTSLTRGANTITMSVYPISTGTSLSLIGATAPQVLTVTEYNSFPALDDAGRTLVTPSQTMAAATTTGLIVSREITVPGTPSAQNFARTIDVFQNPTLNDLSFVVKFTGNLGTDASNVVFSTSDGNTTVAATDQWVGTDDANATGGAPAIIHLIHGPSGLVPVSTGANLMTVTGDSIIWAYNLTVPAGQTLRLAEFTIENATQAGAQADVAALSSGTAFGGEAMTYLTPAEQNSLVNYYMPVVRSVNSTLTAIASYTVGATIPITVTFSEPVTVNDAGGAPTLMMETGAVDHPATYVSGSGTSVLTFNYAVQPGDTSADLNYITAGALTLPAGTTIRDADGYDAILNPPLAGATGSLSAARAITIDTAAPVVTVNPLVTNNLVPTQLTGTVTDALPSIGTLQVSVSFDGGLPIAATVTGTTWSLTLPAGLPDGYRTLVATATDAALPSGNVGSETSSNKLFIDATPPTVTLTLTSPTSDSTPSVRVDASDAGVGVAGATVHLDVDLNFDGDYLDPGEANYTTATLSDGTATFDVTPALADGQYHLQARVSDSVPNEGTSATSTQLVDTSAPTVTLDVGSTPTADTTPSVTITANDNGGVGFASDATAHIDVDLNFDGDYLDPGEANYQTVTLDSGTPFDISPALPDGRFHLRARTSDAFFHEGVSGSQLLEVFLPTTVTNTGDVGAEGDGSLRSAINYVNSHPGLEIHFSILGSTTIHLSSALPAITKQVIIDGTTQLGFVDKPLVELDGSGIAAAGTDGLLFNSTAGGSTVKGLVINRFTGDGIDLSTAANNTIQGNYLGTNAAGNASLGNGVHGLNVAGSGNVIGGLTVAAQNVISGNNNSGIFLTGSGATGNLIQGNYIGTNASGATLANVKTGVRLVNAVSNTIGGTTSQAANVISGNGTGIYVGGALATHNVVEGNFIGTNRGATALVANATAGVYLSGVSLNTIGGTVPGAGNVISGNSNGVYLDSATGNQIQGNYIGTNANGASTLGNGVYGVYLSGASANNVIGGLTDAAQNVIAGNKDTGVYLNGAGATGNLIEGNYIGTNAAGATLANVKNGIRLNGAGSNTVGGTTSEAANVISRNGTGVYVTGATATHNVIEGNFIGTNRGGTVAAPNTGNGVYIGSAGSNTIGGTVPGAGNVISNNSTGVYLDSAAGNQIQGNYIGTNANGASNFGNATYGVYLINDSTSNVIGGLTDAAQNVIAGNKDTGIYLTGTGVTGNLIEGNYVGTNASGALLANVKNGIRLNGAGSNTIGGTTSEAANVISGNGSGVYVGGATATDNVIEGNFIGTNRGATALVPNTTGVYISGSSLNSIGGTVTGAGNVISGNSTGVYLDGGTGTQIQGNYIGTNANGASNFGNTTYGVYLGGASTNNVIGGLTDAAQNVISGNNDTGIYLGGSGVTGNLIEGNYIGTNANGALLGNGKNGVRLNNTGSNTIGGTTSQAANVISGNGTGVYVGGATATHNLIEGNFIGTNRGATALVPNTTNGVYVSSAGLNTIGGTVTGAGNVISGNSTGVYLDSASGTQIQGNYIGTNANGASNFGNTTYGVYLGGASTNNVIGGLTDLAQNVISGNKDTGIYLNGSSVTGNLIEGNYIGTNANGATLANVKYGIRLNNAGSNTVGGTTSEAANAISGNSTGVYVAGATATHNVIEGNFIGTNRGGTAMVPNTSTGVYVSGAGLNTIGGTITGAGNVISGNGSGVVLDGATGTKLQGNYIGTNFNGTLDFGNGVYGVCLLGASTNNVIGGLTDLAQNVISGNNDSGIYLTGSGVTGNLIQGNYIGTNASGATLPNVKNGVRLSSAGSNTIGGTTSQAANVISGNGTGVYMAGTTATHNLIEGNFIGTNRGATAMVPNTTGVYISGASLNTIGGTATGAGNVIAGNASNGVYVLSGTGNTISGNSIYSNGSLGILLGTGANNNQAAPTITSATSGGGLVTISGSGLTANTAYVLDFFANDTSAAGQGKTYLGSVSLTTDGSGQFIDVTVPGSAAGMWVTATATDAAGNTSKFSAPKADPPALAGLSGAAVDYLLAGASGDSDLFGLV